MRLLPGRVERKRADLDPFSSNRQRADACVDDIGLYIRFAEIANPIKKSEVDSQKIIIHLLPGAFF